MTSVTVPEHLSYSQVSGLQQCGGRYYLEKAQKVPQRPSWANVGGTAAHSTTEELDRRLYEAGEFIHSLDTIREIFDSFFELEIEKLERITGFSRDEFRASGRATKEWPNKFNDEWWETKGPEMCLAWARFRDAYPYQIAEVETVDPETGEVVKVLGIELKISPVIGGQPILGSVDRVFVRFLEDGTPEYVVLDLKFGTMVPSGTAQLDTYHAGILDDYGIDARWGTFWMGRTATSTPAADLWATPRAALDFDYRMAHEQRMRGDFRYHPSNLCGSCSVNAYCPSFGGEYAATIPQPWEVTEVALRPPYEPQV